MHVTEIRVLPCGHGEWFDGSGHCGVMMCGAYINRCDLHREDKSGAVCTLAVS
jgi:hypothetical protein